MPLPLGAVLYKNATQTGPPVVLKLRVPSINTGSSVGVYAFVTRPESGGSLHMLHFATADGPFRTIDLTARYGIIDAFGASVFVSDFSGTIKALVNAKPEGTDNGNDRIVFPVDSEVIAYEP